MKEGEGPDAFRHQCLVRWVIKKRIEDRTGAHEWMKLWNKNHPNSILERDVLRQWNLGNRAEGRDWRTE